MHQGKTTLSQANELGYQRFHNDESSIQMSEHDENLWAMPITNPSVVITPEINTPFSSALINNPSTPQVDDTDIEMEVEYVEPRYNLRSQVRNIEIEEIIRESAEDVETELQLPITSKEIDI